ncbi:MAG: molybdopterin-dependent oxidoreductase [Cognatishimia sp.]
MKLQKMMLTLVLTALTFVAPVFANTTTASPDASEAVLEVSGMRSSTEVTVTLDITALRAIGTTEIVTSTIWTDGVHRFSGVLLRDLLKHVGATSGVVVQAQALNDYAIQIPFDDAIMSEALVAFEMDGEPMHRRAKGPLWIVYPFDRAAKFRTETIYARSIWQLNRLHIVK